MVRQLVNMFSFVVAGFLLLASTSVIALWPASFWYEVNAVRVFDTKSGDPVIMAVDRKIHRDFRGEWIASIRRLESIGWVAFCQAEGKANYAKDSQLPEPLTLKWWTHPNCNQLPPGKYVMRTSWVVKGVGIFPDKEVQADSNIFQISD